MNGDRPRALLALTPIAERAIESILFDDDAPVVPVSSVAEADELVGEAADSHAVAALISPQLPGLTGGHCARVRSAGLRLVGLALDDRDREALLAFGMDQIIAADSPPTAFAAALVSNGATPAYERPARRSDPRSDQSQLDRVLAVVGSKGAPGSSECAASLAALSCARWPALLVEIDALSGDLDMRVGGDPQRGSLLGVLRASESDRAQELPDLLDRWVVRSDGWPAVLLGPPDPQRVLHELAAGGAIGNALRALAGSFGVVVCDVGFLLSENGPAARVHREAVVTAACVLLVLGAREGQLRYGLGQLDFLLEDLGVSPERLRLIVNGLGAPGTPSRASIEEALGDRLAQHRVAVDAWLPWDRRALTRAQKRGVPLATARGRGPYARALGRFIDDLFIPTRPVVRTRKHRLGRPAPSNPQVDNPDEEVSLPWRA